MIPLIIFFIKLIEYFIESQRVACIAKGIKVQAAVYAFVEVGIWAIVFKMAFLGVDFYSFKFVENMIAYGLGSAFGTYLGTGIMVGNEK